MGDKTLNECRYLLCITSYTLYFVNVVQLHKKKGVINSRLASESSAMIRKKPRTKTTRFIFMFSADGCRSSLLSNLFWLFQGFTASFLRNVYLKADRFFPSSSCTSTRNPHTSPHPPLQAIQTSAGDLSSRLSRT